MAVMWSIGGRRVGYILMMVVLKLALLSIIPMVYLPIVICVFVRVLGWDFRGKNQYNQIIEVVVKWAESPWKSTA